MHISVCMLCVCINLYQLYKLYHVCVVAYFVRAHKCVYVVCDCVCVCVSLSTVCVCVTVCVSLF